MLLQYRQAIEQHRQRIFSFARYSLRAVDDAEDVTQEVFIKLWQHWPKIDHAKLGAWLMRVAHNAVIDHVRKQRTAQANLDHFADVEQQEGNEDGNSVLDQGVFGTQLQAAIQGLDEPFRSIIILRDIQGLSYQEIQECLSVSESQVKVYLHRSRRKLRENGGLRELFESLTGERSTTAKARSKDEGTRHA